jgi:hypothetical protein
MKQLTQKLKSGEMQVLEVPVPHVRSGSVLVRNRFSVVSAGTEGSTVQAARKGYIGKAQEKPEQGKQVTSDQSREIPLFSKCPFHIPGPVNHGEYLDVIIGSNDSIDNSVIPENDFPEPGIAKFRHNSAASRDLFQFFSGTHECLDGSHGINF